MSKKYGTAQVCALRIGSSQRLMNRITIKIILASNKKIFDNIINMKTNIIVRSFLITAMIIIGLAGCASPPPPVKGPSAESQQAKNIVQSTSTPDMPSSLPVPTQDPNATAKGIVQGQPVPGSSPPLAATPIQQTTAFASDALTPDEAKFLQTYLNRISYLVYYNENSGLDPQLAKAAVSQANRYLIEKLGLSVIDFDQIQKNKKDQMSAYQSETGGSIDIITYIAQKLNADIYLEIDAKTSFGGGPGSWSGSAQGSMKIFDASTAALLGAISFLSPQTFSPVSSDAAMMNAIAGAVWLAMPKVTEQSKALMASSVATRGVRYELILQNTPDAKSIAQFQRNLSKKVREVEQLSYAPGESRFALYAFMPASRIQDAIYEAASAAGFPDSYLLYMRGRSYTFNTGL